MSRAVPGRPEHKEETLRDTMDGKLILTKLRERTMAFLIKENRLVQACVISDPQNTVGAIYLGKIKKLVPNIACCFVEIRKGELLYLSLEDAKFSYPVNRAPDGRLLEGDELLVQIQRDALKTKQAAGTTKISLAGKYVVFQVGDTKTGFSAKLDGIRKKRILKALQERGFVDEQGRTLLSPKSVRHDADARNLEISEGNTSEDLEKLPPYGIIVRTEAGQVSDEEILGEYERLKARFVRIFQTSRHFTCFTCVSAPSPVEVLAGFPGEYGEIVTDQKELYQILRETLPRKSEENGNAAGNAAAEEFTERKQVLVRLYEDPDYSLERLYGLETKLEKALSRRVWLKSGAYLVIDITEALTVIDVNSGKYDAKRASEDAICQINLEAAKEVAFQIRLRNLSGIILVDFISMNSAQSDHELLQELRNAVKQDKVPTKVVDMTALGFVEITRKKINKTLAEQLAGTNKSEEKG